MKREGKALPDMYGPHRWNFSYGVTLNSNTLSSHGRKKQTSKRKRLKIFHADYFVQSNH